MSLELHTVQSRTELICSKRPVTHMAGQSGGERCSVSPLLATAHSERPNTNGTLMAFSTATFPTSSPFLPPEQLRWQAPSEVKAARKPQPTTRSQPSCGAVVAALNESSGLCGTRAGRESVFTAEETSSPLEKERHYKHATAVSSGSDLRTGLLSLQGLNDAGRTSGNLEGPAATPSERGWHPPNLNGSMEGLWRGVGDKWSDFGSWFYPLRKENTSVLFLIHLPSPFPPQGPVQHDRPCFLNR